MGTITGQKQTPADRDRIHLTAIRSISRDVLVRLILEAARGRRTVNAPEIEQHIAAYEGYVISQHKGAVIHVLEACGVLEHIRGAEVKSTSKTNHLKPVKTYRVTKNVADAQAILDRYLARWEQRYLARQAEAERIARIAAVYAPSRPYEAVSRAEAREAMESADFVYDPSEA